MKDQNKRFSADSGVTSRQRYLVARYESAPDYIRKAIDELLEMERFEKKKRFKGVK